MTPALKSFIDKVIVPALREAYLASGLKPETPTAPDKGKAA